MRLIRNPEITASRIDDEIVMMSAETGKYYTLNRTAAAIWEALDETSTVDDLVMSLMRQFDVPEATCRRDVDECLASIMEKRIILRASL